MRHHNSKHPSRNHRACVFRRRKTRFVELFRTTPVNTVCPNFFVLRHAAGCAFSPACAYCYLKSSFWYLARPHVFTNLQSLLTDVRRWIQRDHLESHILNMGNLSDSLVFESVRPILPRLIEVFREAAERQDRPHSLLLVTKGGLRECRGLLKIPACRNIIISFSVNAPDAARRYEPGAASVPDRLDAARRLNALGWRLRIRIDPIIAGFTYEGIADQVRHLAPERVTLGTLRAEPALPRFAARSMFAALVRPRSGRGLARYPTRERLRLYRRILKPLRKVCPIGLCEETPYVWKALGLNAEAKTCNCGF